MWRIELFGLRIGTHKKSPVLKQEGFKRTVRNRGLVLLVPLKPLRFQLRAYYAYLIHAASVVSGVVIIYIMLL